MTYEMGPTDISDCWPEKTLCSRERLRTHHLGYEPHGNAIFEFTGKRPALRFYLTALLVKLKEFANDCAY